MRFVTYHRVEPGSHPLKGHWPSPLLLTANGWSQVILDPRYNLIVGDKSPRVKTDTWMATCGCSPGRQRMTTSSTKVRV
jgi:hypothetical protein